MLTPALRGNRGRFLSRAVTPAARHVLESHDPAVGDRGRMRAVPVTAAARCRDGLRFWRWRLLSPAECRQEGRMVLAATVGHESTTLATVARYVVQPGVLA